MFCGWDKLFEKYMILLFDKDVEMIKTYQICLFISKLDITLG